MIYAWIFLSYLSSSVANDQSSSRTAAEGNDCDSSFVMSWMNQKDENICHNITLSNTTHKHSWWSSAGGEYSHTFSRCRKSSSSTPQSAIRFEILPCGGLHFNYEITRKNSVNTDGKPSKASSLQLVKTENETYVLTWILADSKKTSSVVGYQIIIHELTSNGTFINTANLPRNNSNFMHKGVADSLYLFGLRVKTRDGFGKISWARSFGFEGSTTFCTIEATIATVVVLTCILIAIIISTTAVCIVRYKTKSGKLIKNSFSSSTDACERELSLRGYENVALETVPDMTQHDDTETPGYINQASASGNSGREIIKPHLYDFVHI